MSLLNRVGWSILKQTIRAEFPQVHQISPDTLTDWLDSEQADLVLLDTRTEAEYAVSHLANARQVDPKIENLASLELAIDTPIVTYCSVGYRSARIADRLQTAGYTNVVNLEGSIFQWANEGKPVYRNGLQVQEVHPFDSRWAQLLNSELRAYEPDEP
jgi:rhodanese-related sulfurtransferase